MITPCPCLQRLVDIHQRVRESGGHTHTDRQTDRQTSDHSTCSACAYRGVQVT